MKLKLYETDLIYRAEYASAALLQVIQNNKLQYTENGQLGSLQDHCNLRKNNKY